MEKAKKSISKYRPGAKTKKSNSPIGAGNKRNSSNSSFFHATKKSKSSPKPTDVDQKNSSPAFFRKTDDANSVPSLVGSNNSEKKPFDKKTWRLKKYSNKYKLEQWKDKRKHKVEIEYQKRLKHEPKVDVQKIYEQEDSETEANNDNNTNEDIQQERQAMSKSAAKRLRKGQRRGDLVDENTRKKEEFERKQLEKKAALEAYKQKKIERFKILNKKTKRGQPLMKGRMELLLEDIQNSLQKEAV